MHDDFSDISDGPDGIEGRVAQLEATVKREAGLRADMDGELGTISAKLTAHQQSLNALQEVQSDHTKRLTRIEGKVDNAEIWLGHLSGRMNLVEDRLTGVEGKLTGVEGRLTGVEGQLTGVESRLTGVETTLGDVKAGVNAILQRLNNN